jgi:hypothetical protein
MCKHIPIINISHSGISIEETWSKVFIRNGNDRKDLCKTFISIKKEQHGGPVAHIYNPSYQEAEIRRIMVQRQPRRIVHEILSQK